jgi:hypothetical protein
MKSNNLQDVTPCILVGVNRHFGGFSLTSEAGSKISKRPATRNGQTD